MKITLTAAAAMLVASATASPTIGYFNDLKCKIYKCDDLCNKYPNFISWPKDTVCKLYGCEQRCNYPQLPSAGNGNQPKTVTITKTQPVTEFQPGPTKTVTVTKGSNGGQTTVTVTKNQPVTEFQPGPTKTVTITKDSNGGQATVTKYKTQTVPVNCPTSNPHPDPYST